MVLKSQYEQISVLTNQALLKISQINHISPKESLCVLFITLPFV